MSACDDRRAERGFTLVEVLVASVIAALALGALLRLLGGSLEATGNLKGRTIALLEARAKLAEVGVLQPLVSGSTSGTMPSDDRWSVEIRAIESSLDGVHVLFEVVVEVAHGDGGTAQLMSYRVGSSAAAE